jgi:predicted dehydrogenase
MTQLTRRNFIHTSGTLATAGLLIQTKAGYSSNDVIHHAVIGTGGQGRGHCARFHEQDTLCKVTTICDVDPVNRAKAVEVLGGDVKTVEDYRRVLEDDTIHTVSIATPDHWHTKIAVEAILAGKHVYVEKPCSHNIHEGVILAKAASLHKKCVQHGTQSRSGKGIQDAIQFMNEGSLGKIRFAKAINHQHRKDIGRAPESNPPEGVNYNLWLGPAPVHPFTQNRWHYNWHWFWDYGTGDTGNDGIHQIDVARWGLGVGAPTSVSAPGGQLLYDDDHQTPDTQTAIFDYGDKQLMYEMRLWTGYKLEGHDNGTIFYGDEGKVEIGRKGSFVLWKNGETEQLGGGSDSAGHTKNFLESAKANDPSMLNAPITECYRSAELCHLANIATRVGKTLAFDGERHTFPQDKDAQNLIQREYRAGFELPNIG